MRKIGRRKSGPQRILTLIVFFLLAFGAAALGNAATIGIVGIETTVSITSFDVLTSAGFDISPLGDATVDATVDPPEITFPITGGSVDTTTDDALIEHDNSGFSLEKDAKTIEFRNFLIDTKEAVLFSDTTYKDFNISEFRLFDLSPAGDQFKLTFTAQAALVLDLIYELDLNLTGAEFGLATVDLQVVPIPAALPLLLSGLAGLAVLRRKFRH